MDDAVRGAGDGGGEALHHASAGPSPSDLAAENAQLRRENERLRIERDILKKAALIFGSASR